MSRNVVTDHQINPDGEKPGVSIARVSFEHHGERETLGIGEARPRLSWTVTTLIKDWQQAGYKIELYSPDGKLLEQTGRVMSSPDSR